MAQTKANESIAGDLVTGLLNTPGVKEALIEQVFGALAGLIGKLFGGGKKEKPTVPVVVPTPAPDSPEDFPDDVIPAPAPTRKVASVRLKVSRIQLNKQRFPEAYTPGNPFGLLSKEGVEGGANAIPNESKVWLDLTAYDEQGREFLRDAVLSHALSFQTEHHVGDAFIVGGGAKADGSPADWKQNDTDAVGHGITAWTTSLGFLHQVKLRAEGEFECSGSVGGVPSNTFKIRVS